MRGHKLIGWVIGVPLLIAVLILVILNHEPEKEGISRAMAARSLALAVVSPEDLSSWKKEYGASHFPADAVKEWYVPYMDYLYEQGILSEADIPADRKHAEDLLTFRDAARMMEALEPGLESLVKMSKKNQDDPFPEERWWLLYDSVLRKADPEGQVRTERLVIYGTPDNMQGVPAWTAHTNLGAMKFSGLAMDRYLDHELSAFVRGNEIIHVIEDKGSSTTYRNVWILDGSERELMVYIGEIQRKIPFQKKSKKSGGMIHHMADLEMEDGEIVKVSLKEETITGKVLSVNEEAIELEGYGAVPLDEECKVLKTYGDVKRMALSDILVGEAMEEFVVADGKICGVLIVRELDAEFIRVLLMDQGFRNIFHETISLSCGEDMVIRQGKKDRRLKAGEAFTISSGDESLRDGRVILEAENGGEIALTSLERGHGTPSYGGRLEIVQGEDGLVLINELYLEDYLKKVVPSEMPSSYEMEALKAQAVCARTYAYMQLQSNTYSQYGAQVDDSTNFQVYNNMETDGRTAEAVQATYGKMLMYGGSPVSAYYFSTSCGVTADASLWGSDPADMPYLACGTLQPGRQKLNLKNESDFASFIKRMDYPAYDSSYPFYRWNVTTNAQILTEEIGGVGQVTGIRISERGSSGVAEELLVTGIEGEKRIRGQNAIRAALGDSRLTINRKDGKTTTGWSSLPSGFLTIEDGGTGEAGVKQFKIYGGGYGHGVGMSQNGAQGMAKNGSSCEEILKFFYSGVSVEEIP